MIAYKLLRKRRDGSLGPLFINCRQRVPIGRWMPAEFHPRSGYAPRKGWHCTILPVAPHISKKGRVWCAVEVKNLEHYTRPVSQGGTWVLAQEMKILGEIK